MADLDNVWKALRLVPEFDGNPNILTRFIGLCDQLVREYIRPAEEYSLVNAALINGILNKITGPAARLINSNGVSENWQGIRGALINNFADQRDETSLYNDLALLTQGSCTPQEFYEKCQNLYSTLMTYINLHENIHTTIESKRELYKKLTLQAYLRGLKDPLGSRIRCMRPESIEKALEYVHEEMNTLYLQQRNESMPDRKHNQNLSNKFNMNSLPPQPQPNMHKPFVFNMPGPSRAYQAPVPPRPPMMWKPNNNFYANNQYRGPTRTQQIFSAQPSNHNPRSNVFAVPQRTQPNTYTPRPMSGVSHYAAKPMPLTGHDWRRQGNPPATNYFKTREMNLNECYPQYDYEPHNDMYYDPYQSNYYCEYPEQYYNESSEENMYYPMPCPPDNALPTGMTTQIEEIPNDESRQEEDFHKDRISNKRK
jgi:hypothetical protein